MISVPSVGRGGTSTTPTPAGGSISGNTEAGSSHPRPVLGIYRNRRPMISGMYLTELRIIRIGLLSSRMCHMAASAA